MSFFAGYEKTKTERNLAQSINGFIGILPKFGFAK